MNDRPYTELIYSAHPVQLTRAPIRTEYPTRPGHILVGTYLEGTLIAQNDFLPHDPMAGTLPDSVHLALAGAEVGPGQGIRATIFGLIPVEEAPENGTDDEARWRDGTPPLEGERTFVPPGLGLVVLGQIGRIAELRRHPNDLRSELMHILERVLSRQVTTVGDQALQALVSGPPTNPAKPPPL